MDFAAGRIRVPHHKGKYHRVGAELAALPERGLCGRHGLMGGVLPGRAPLLPFGQKARSACAHLASEQEGSVVANLKRKEADAKAMGDALASEVIATACVTN